MSRERKPPWLRLLAPAGNTMGYKGVRCGCGRWVLEVRGRSQWDRYDPGVITGEDLTTAIICRRTLSRLTPTTGAPTLETVWGGLGIEADGQYLEHHDCALTPVSQQPYKPLRAGRRRRDLSFLPKTKPYGTDPWAATEAAA